MKTKFNVSRSTLNAALLCLPLAVAGPTSAFEAPGRPPAPSLHPESGQWLSKVPKGFIPNVGQWRNEAVRFGLRDSGATAFFTDEGFVLWNGQTTATTQDGREIRTPVAPRWQLVGARPVEPVGGETFKHTVSFFRGNNPAKWRANVPAYRELHYQEILQGVDLHVESREHGFEYTFHVEPHAKPELRLRYDGVTGLEKSLTGDLIVHTATGHFTESRPVSFQVIEGRRQEVPSAFEIVSANEYRIAVGPYDKRHALVIDPVLDWSTFLGGTSSVNLRDVKVAPDGNLCIIGGTTSVDLPDTAGFSTGPGVGGGYDVVVAKLNSSGTELLWLGYLAGAGAANDEVGFGNGLALDGAGDLHIVGSTASPDFPVTGGASHAGGSDVFITKISSDGSAILRSSLLGGTSDDYGWGIGLDAQENVLVTGFTRSGNFPATVGAFDMTLGGAQDAFVAKFHSSGTLQWSSFLGGATGEERGAAIVADAAGDILVTGDTESSDFPVTAGVLDTMLGGTDDAFVAKIQSDGMGIVWATFVGGSGVENDKINPFSSIPTPRGDLTLDSAGNILIAGQTLSSDFPATSGAFQTTLAGDMDGYVAKLTSDGASLIWASYLGGSGGDQYQEIIWGITVNPWDEVFLIGRTDSPNFPVTQYALQASFQGGLQDGFLTKLSANGSSLLYSTYLGGSQNRDVALGIAYDSGNVFVAGWGASASYPTTAGAYQTACSSCVNGWADGVMLKFLDAFIACDGFGLDPSPFPNSGLGDWAGAWTVSGDVSILTTSGPHSGSRHVRLRSSTGYLQRTVNLPPASASLRLGFWGKVDSFEGSDHAVVLAKSTGASFTTVASFTSAHSDNKYHYYEFDLTSFLPATQIQIAFDAAMSAVNDNWYLDDIRVTGTSGSVPPVAAAGADQSVTDNDNTGAETVTLNGSASFDPDGGGIVAYEWKEGATVIGNGVGISPSLSVGVHTITLTVTDDEGATDTDTVVVTVTPPLHSGDLDGSSANAGKNWKATVVVTIHDGNHTPVQGATVSIQWSGGASGTASLTTDANGRCTFISGNISKQSPSATLTITSVTHATLAYSAAANHDPDGDSNGTSITVLKP